MRLRPLRELFLSRLRQFFREPETIFWVYVFPLLLMAGLGLAFGERSSVRIRVAVAAGEASELERLAGALERASTDDAEIVVERLAPGEAIEDRDQRFDLAVIGRGGSLEYRFDPARQQSRHAHAVVDRVLQESAGRSDPLPAAVREVREPGSRYIDWLIPGLLGLNIMGGGLWGIGFVTVDMRIRKLLKHLQATPMRRSDFLLSLIGARLFFLIPETAAILLAGRFFFGLEVRGGLGALALVVLLGGCCFASLGLLIASRAQKLETISGLLNAVMLPMWLLSGVFFASRRFPDAMQPVIEALPLTQLNHALRGVILEGHGAPAEWPALAVLVAWGAVAFPLALRCFRWR